MSARTFFHGPLPPVGARIRKHHPWLGPDGLEGTVRSHEFVDGDSELRWPDGHRYGRYRVHLVDCVYDGRPHQDTYMDNLGETWEFLDQD